ncbi:MAG: Antilisterial bacteriocin subtilosin biosynthesis protein AlbA [Syntrophomonadaceae bacterium]|nr:Antilisterial bacteriocin subtilosin biosynthesis protein AlbA [Bacillota bacterium]
MLINDKKEFPALKEGYVLHKSPKQSLVYSFTSDNKNLSYFVNKDASKILELCDGKTCTHDIAQVLACQYQEDYKSVLSVIKSYLGTIPFIDILNHPSHRDMRITGNWEILTPTHVSIELTYKCSFSCRHCYGEFGPNSEIFFNKVKVSEVLKDLAAYGVAVIELTGGDPLAHPDFFSILEECLQLFPSVCVNTNGYLLNEKYITPFREYKERLIFQIDLHGDNAEYVDWFCNCSGAFENAKKAIRMISKEGFIVRVVMAITPKNLNQVFNTATLAQELGATNFMVSSIVPTGRGKSPDLIFTSQNIPQLLQQVEVIIKKFEGFIFKVPEHIMLDKKEGTNCGAGSRTICLTPNGDVKLCPMSHSNILCLGNVYAEELKEIFTKNLFQIIEKTVDPRPEICGKCEHLDYCSNCLARGLQKYSDIGKACLWGTNVSLILKEADKFA